MFSKLTSGALSSHFLYFMFQKLYDSDEEIWVIVNFFIIDFIKEIVDLLDTPLY